MSLLKPLPLKTWCPRGEKLEKFLFNVVGI